MTKHLHNLANYPTSFKGTVVSPTKICMQFGDVQVKLRRNEQSSEYLKMPNGDIAMPIATTGTDIGISAMGCQMPVLEEAQFGLINAYMTYGKYNSEIYRQKYDKEFIDFLLNVQIELTKAIQYIQATASKEDDDEV